MSLNQVKLDPTLLTQLYQRVLVETATKDYPAVPFTNTNKENKLKALGGNKKKICILVKQANAVFLQDEQLAYLTRILQACKLTLEDVAIINLHGNKAFNYQLIQQQYPYSTCLAFGLTPPIIELPADFPFFQLQKIEGSTYLFAPTLDQLEPVKIDREKLWQSLRKHFNV